MSIYDKEAPEGMYLRFKHGTTARVRFFGDAIDFFKSFKPDQPAKQRFATLVLYRNKEMKCSEVRVFEFGWEIQKRIKALVKDDDWGDPTGYDVEITATGDGLDREYQVVPKPKGALNEKDKALIADCQIDLIAATVPTEVGEPAEPSVKAGDPEADEYNPFADS